MNPLISVIIPVYNVEPYLEKCLDSVINQTYHNLEIIIVDDGSTDHCPAICDKYAGKDQRIIVIHQENGGLSSARNAGLNIAKGEYIAFVDSDDWLELDIYQVLIHAAGNTDADMIVCDAYYCKYGTNQRVTSSCNSRVITIIEDNNDIFFHILNPTPTIRFEVWNKLFRRFVIADTRFKIGQRYEDIYFDRVVFSRVNKCVFVDAALYNYLTERPGSTICSFNIGRISKLDELDEYIRYFKENDRDDIAYSFLLYATETAVFFYCTASMLGNDEDVKSIILDRFESYYKAMSNPSCRYQLFHISPSLFVWIVKIKALFK